MAKRRCNGEGSIFMRKDKRWCAKLSMARGDTGKIETRTVYGKTQADVKAKLEEVKRQAAVGFVSSSTRFTFGTWLTHWLEYHVKPELRRSTYVDYDCTVRNHLMSDPIVDVPLTKMTAEQIEKFIARLRSAGKSNRILSKSYMVTRRALNMATKRRHIADNPCRFIDPPKYDSGEAKTLNSDQLKALLIACEGERLEALVKLAIATGMRLGELLGLQWSDIDLDRGVLTVRRSQSELSGVVRFGKPKSKSGVRTLSLDAFAVDTLEEHRKRMFAEGNYSADGLVFRAIGGGPLRRTNMRRAFWNRVLEEAGINVPFHALRHTSATLMLSAGVHIKVAQQRLGHSKVGVTLDTYSHVLDGMDSEAAGLIGAAMKLATKKSENVG